MILLMQIIDTVGRVVAISIASILLWASLFIYEDEEKKVQSLLEDIWIRIDDARVKQAALVRELANMVRSVVDAFLGPTLLSIRVFSITISLGFLFLSFWVFLVCTYLAPKVQFISLRAFTLAVAHHYHIVEWAVLSMIFFALLMMASANRHHWVRITASLISIGLWSAALAGMILAPYQFNFQNEYSLKMIRLSLWGWTLALIISLALLAFNRYAVAKLVQAVTVGRLAQCVAVNIFVCILFLWAPIDSALNLISWSGTPYSILKYIPEDFINIISATSSFGAAVIPTVVFIVISLFLTVHRFIGFAVDRVFYALQRYKILRFKKTLAGIAFAILGIAVEPLHRFFATVARVFDLL